jgi:hypothetical protein
MLLLKLKSCTQAHFELFKKLRDQIRIEDVCLIVSHHLVFDENLVFEVNTADQSEQCKAPVVVR